MNPGVTLLALPLTSVSVSQKAQHVLLTKTKKNTVNFKKTKSFRASRGAIMANSPTVRKYLKVSFYHKEIFWEMRGSEATLLGIVVKEMI